MGVLHEQVIDRTGNGKFPLKKGGILQDGNLSQDEDGIVRASTKIIAEQGVDTLPGTVTLGDGMDLKASGPQQVNVSKVTGIKYQVPYQQIEKTGQYRTKEVKLQNEIKEIRQPVYDSVLSSPLGSTLTVPKNESVNAIYIRTNGSISNLRFKFTSVVTGEVIDSYPDKFKFEKGEGVNIPEAGEYKIDMYYLDDSTPPRFLGNQEIIINVLWENGTGTILGNPEGLLYYAVDLQEFE